MKHFLWSLVLVFLAAAPAWSKPNFVSINRPPSTSGGTLLFGIGDTEDSVAVGVNGFCTVRFEQASGDDVSLYAVTSQSTAATSGALLKAFSSSTSPSNPAYTFTASTQWVKAKAVDATAGGSKLIIECNPTFGSSGGGGGSFDACRSGQTQGGGYSTTDGRWAWTCGNYPWREWQDSTVANSASFTVLCTGDGTGTLTDGSTSAGANAYSCLRSGETRYIGYGLNVAVAAAYTRDGGKVYLPEGIYVDNGAGTNAAGQATGFPKPYDPEWEARSDFAVLGYPTALRAIQLNRGVRLIGEGVPSAITYSPSDTSVTEHRPKLSGTWIVDDRGLPNATASSNPNTLGGTNSDIESPLYYRMLVGNNPYLTYCHTDDADADSDGVLSECLTNSTSDAPENAQDSYSTVSPYGASFPTTVNFATSSGLLCVPDDRYVASGATAADGLGTNQSDAIGTCSGNRKIRCWDDSDTSEPRSSGGCFFDANEDYGACQSPATALIADYETAGQDLQIAWQVTECDDNASSSTGCATPRGWEMYIMEFRAAPGADMNASGNCGTGGTATAGQYMQVGNAHPSNDYSQVIPFQNFYVGGTGATNALIPIRRGALDGKGAGFENIGRMPANWLTRNSATNAADCLSSGTVGASNDESVCDTDTLSGFAMSYNNLIGPNNLYFKVSQENNLKSGVVETYPGGGKNNFIGNTIRTHYRQTVVDWGNGILGYNHFSDLGAYPGTAYDWAACYGGECTFEGNTVENSAVVSIYNLSSTSPQRVVSSNNIFRNISTTGYYYAIFSPKNVLSTNDQVYGLYGVPLVTLQPGLRVSGVDLLQKPSVVFKDMVVVMQNDGSASNNTSGGGSPKSLFVVQGDPTANSVLDDYKSFIIDGGNFETASSDSCLVWFEDDFYNNGGAGGAADTASLNREAASRSVIMNVNFKSATSVGGAKIACTGKYRFTNTAPVSGAATPFDADDSDTWAFELYAPTLINNKVNNAPYPDMLPTISEAGLDADNLPDGTRIRIHDGSATPCQHTSGDLTAGAAIASCVSDPGTSGSSIDGTWTAF